MIECTCVQSPVLKRKGRRKEIPEDKRGLPWPENSSFKLAQWVLQLYKNKDLWKESPEVMNGHSYALHPIRSDSLVATSFLSPDTTTPLRIPTPTSNIHSGRAACGHTRQVWTRRNLVVPPPPVCLPCQRQAEYSQAQDSTWNRNVFLERKTRKTPTCIAAGPIQGGLAPELEHTLTEGHQGWKTQGRENSVDRIFSGNLF